MSLRFGLVLLACLGLVGAGGCSQPSVKVDGSSTVHPIAEAVAEEYRKEQPQVRVIVSKSGTGGGMKKFAVGEIDICNASRPMKDSEKEECQKHGVEFVEFEIAFDGLAVVVNPANDWCDCLTVEQLKAIWQPESAVTKWSDVNADWPEEKIILYGPGIDSGTFEYFNEVIVGGARKSRTADMASEDDNMLVNGVAGDKNSLGYFGFAYFEENHERLKLLGIDSGDGECVKPSQETVRDNSYHPLSRPLFIYVSKAALGRPEVKAFVEYYLSKAGTLAPEVGYVAVPVDTAVKNQQLFDEVTGTSAKGT